MYITHSSEYQTVPKLKNIDLSEEPILTDRDIEEYIWSSHEISFSAVVHENIKKRGNLIHKIFVIVANGQRIYWGKFMDDLDSGVCQNPVIRIIPRHPDGRNTTPDKFIIERAYPGYSGSATDSDIRNNKKAYHALLNAQILSDN